MPSVYTHYRFGKQVLPTLRADARQTVQRFRRLYDMGLLGPDIFYYYNPFVSTAVDQLGSAFHGQSGQEFFTRACAQAKTEADRAYLYGLLGHYCLDSHCHPFVKKQVEAGTAGHVEMETEFDRALLEKDGLVPPHQQDLSLHMKTTRGECTAMAAFYPGATPGNVSRCIKNQILFQRLLVRKNRRGTARILKKMRPGYADNLMGLEPNPKCAATTKGLQVYYDRAAAKYPSMLAELLRHMETGEALGEDFSRTFG